MQTAFAQIATLTIHGNATLQGKSDGRELQNVSVFGFCEYANFLEIVPNAPGGEERMWATGPHDWFERLKREGVRRLKLWHASSGSKDVADRMLVGFVGGGGRWVIESRGATQSDFWEARWRVGDRTRADRKIWQVSYLRIASAARPPDGVPDDLVTLKREMAQCLVNIAEFSRSQKLDGFTKAFESSLAKLDSSSPLDGVFFRDLSPHGFLPLVAAQLFGATEAAWVFGGMGSWNDQGFPPGEIQARYDKVSEDLYNILNRAVVAVANASIRHDS